MRRYAAPFAEVLRTLFGGGTMALTSLLFWLSCNKGAEVGWCTICDAQLTDSVQTSPSPLHLSGFRTRLVGGGQALWKWLLEGHVLARLLLNSSSLEARERDYDQVLDAPMITVVPVWRVGVLVNRELRAKYKARCDDGQVTSSFDNACEKHHFQYHGLLKRSNKSDCPMYTDSDCR